MYLLTFLTSKWRLHIGSAYNAKVWFRPIFSNFHYKSMIMFYRSFVAMESMALCKTMGSAVFYLTHWDRVTHICVVKLTIMGSDNGLLPGRRQAIICTNAGILLIRPLGTNFSEIAIEVLTFSFTKIIWKCCLRNGGHFVSASMC